MPAIGMLLGWLGYSVGLWGWCMVRDYDVTFGQLVSPLHPYGSGKGQKWPPAALPDTQIWPGKQTASSSRQGTSPAPGQPPKNGKCPPGQIVVNGKCMSLVQD